MRRDVFLVTGGSGRARSSEGQQASGEDYNRSVEVLALGRSRVSALFGNMMVSKKEGSSILCLVAGIGLVSVCLSLVCVVQVFFIVPQHCSCLTSDGSTEPFVSSNDGKNGAFPSKEDTEDNERLRNVSTATKQTQSSLSDLEHNTQENLSRKKRAAVSDSGIRNLVSTLQQQVFFLESR